MYNEELKSMFINGRYAQTPARAIASRKLFTALQKYEEEWQADICTRSGEDIMQAIDKTMKRSVRSHGVGRTKISILKDYINWCLLCKIPGANPDALNIQPPKVDQNISNNMLGSPDDLATYLNKVFSSEEDNSPDLVYRCFCWLAYSGISETDVMEVRSKDVALEDGYILCKNVRYPLYPQSVKTIKKCMFLEDFLVFSHNRASRYKRVDGDTLIRSYKSGATIAKIQTSFAKKVTQAMSEGRIDKRISYYQVWLSGVFHRAYEVETSLNVSPLDSREYFERLVEKQMSTKKYVLKKGSVTINTIKNRQIKEYMRDYELWKSLYKEA